MQIESFVPSTRATTLDAVVRTPLVSNNPVSTTSTPETRPSSVRPRVITTKPHLPISDLDLRARVRWSVLTSDHFQLSCDSIALADPQCETLLEALETAYQKIFSLTRERFQGRLPVFTVDHRTPELLGRAVKSHFNVQEKALYLVQTSSQHLLTDLVRLVSHAMRGERYSRHYGQTDGWAMLEDSFSIFLHHRLSALPDTFPFYGAEPDVIANHLYSIHAWSLSDSWLSPGLTTDHQVLGGAFFLYLGDTYSDERIVTFSKVDGSIGHETFKEFYGINLFELENAWRAHLPASLIKVTHDEQEEMIFNWEKAIECKRI